MSTYELNDDDVRAMLDKTEYGGPELAKVVLALQKQLTTPLPTKVGAVVRTAKGVLVNADPFGTDKLPWRSIADGSWYTSAEIGVIEVLSEGVDL